MTAGIYLDTNVFIGAFETMGDVSKELWRLFDRFWRGDLTGVTSELTLAELLPKLLKTQQFGLVEAYKLLLATGTRPVDVIPVSRDILIAAAALRSADASVKLPDAIHAATARQRGCRIFLSGDRRLPTWPDIRIVPLGPQCLATIDRLTT